MKLAEIRFVPGKSVPGKSAGLKYGDIAAEAWSMTISQKVASALTAVVVGAMCLAVLLTAGRTNASQQEILKTIESQANRAIVVRVEPQADVSLDAVNALSGIRELEWVGAFGGVQDVHNPQIGTSLKVGSRTVITQGPSAAAMKGFAAQPDLALTTPQGAQTLGLIDGAGYVTGVEADTTVARAMPLPDFLQWLDPIVLIPVPNEKPYLDLPAAIIVAVPTAPEHVPAVSATIKALLAPAEADAITIETPEQLNALRSLVEEQLTGVHRSLVIGMFAVLVVLVSALLYGLVMIRRKDYGRRRALGATRSLIVGLIVMNTALVAVAGAVGGSTAALGVLYFTQGPLPAPAFVATTIILAVGAALAGSVVPGLVASHRDPLTELRVP